MLDWIIDMKNTKYGSLLHVKCRFYNPKTVKRPSLFAKRLFLYMYVHKIDKLVLKTIKRDGVFNDYYRNHENWLPFNTFIYVELCWNMRLLAIFLFLRCPKSGNHVKSGNCCQIPGIVSNPGILVKSRELCQIREFRDLETQIWEIRELCQISWNINRLKTPLLFYRVIRFL